MLKTAVIISILALSLVGSGCSKKKKKKTTPEGARASTSRKAPRSRRIRVVHSKNVTLLKCQQEEGGRVVTYDLDRDRKVTIDMWKVYRKDGTVSCREMDLNFDGKRDQIVFYYGDGASPREIWQDQDFDGKFDIVLHLRADRSLAQVELDTNSDGKMDTWKHYRLNADKKNNVFRVARDRDHDGYKDYWERYDENGNIEEVSWNDEGSKDEKPKYWLSSPAKMSEDVPEEKTKQPEEKKPTKKKGKPGRGED